MDLHQRHPVLVLEKRYSLDLAFTNLLNTKFESLSEVLLAIDPHYPPPAFIIPFKDGPLRKTCFTYRNYRRADYDKINDELNKIDSDKELNGINCECELEFLYEILNKLIVKYVPIKNRKPIDYLSWRSGTDLQTER